MKPPILRQSADNDIDRAFTYYLQDAGASVATDFIEAVDAALSHIEDYPSAGSQRYGEVLENPGLRSWVLNRFPYTLFYVEHEDHLDILRLLHQKSDIPEQLQF